MNNIATIQNFPNRTPLETVQGRITAVFEHKQIPDGRYGPTSCQNLYLEDSTGKIKVEAWGQDDLTGLKGHEVVIQASGTGKGVSVAHNVWQGKTEVRLSLSKAAHITAIGEAVKGPSVQSKAVSVPASTKPATVTVSAPYIAGEAVGAAINKAVDLIIAAGVEAYEDRDHLLGAVHQMASGIYKVGERMKAGDFCSGESVTTTQTSVPDVQPEPKPTSPDVDEDQIPF